jgi:hypothetical protein
MHTSGAATIGSNLKVYANGWGGNQYVMTGRVATGAKIVGNVFVGASAVLDGYAWYNNEISTAKLGENLAVDALAVWGGPVGAGIALGYYGLETFYPGGANGAASDAFKEAEKLTGLDRATPQPPEP